MYARSFRDAHGLEEKSIGTLENIEYYKPDRHFRRLFLTAYQLAILFKHRVPKDFNAFGHPLWGKRVRRELKIDWLPCGTVVPKDQEWRDHKHRGWISIQRPIAGNSIQRSRGDDHLVVNRESI